MKLDIYNKAGSKLTDTLEVNDDVFGIEPNEHCVYLAVKAEQANIRQGTHASKSRSDVSGGGRKPWRQKGTGRSRIGSTRNPSRVHGGTAFGPEPRDYFQKVNKKVKLLARRSVLSQKVAEGSLWVVDDLTITEPRTREFVQLLENLKLADKKITVLVADVSESLWLSSRNLQNVYMIPAQDASTYDLLDNQVLLVDRAGIETINTQLTNQP